MTDDTLTGVPGALPPKFDLVGPTIDDDIRRLVSRYGSLEFKQAVKRMTPVKRGRKSLPDWAELAPLLDDDAVEWLEGGDPFARTSHFIAKIFSEKHPGHDVAATRQRIAKKLRRKTYGRRWYVYGRAMEMSGAKFPFKRHLRALEALIEEEPDSGYQSALRRKQSAVADYSAKWGEPADDLTMLEIEQGSIKEVSLNGPSSFLGPNVSHPENF